MAAGTGAAPAIGAIIIATIIMAAIMTMAAGTIIAEDGGQSSAWGVRSP